MKSVTRVPLALCALAAAAIAAPARAVETRSWTLTDPTDLARGIPEGIATGPRGALTLGPRLQPLALASRGDTGQPILWCLAQDGSSVYAGTGDEGNVLRAGADGSVELLASLPEPHVTALAVLPSGRLAAATSPEGAVYSIAKDGTADVLLEPDERYIWSLAAARDGSLYVGTGERGRIYKVDSNGDGTLFYDGDDAHIVSLGWDRQGRLLAGTASQGLLLRLDAAGHATVLLDADQAEIASIAVDGTGAVYAAAFPRRKAPPAPSRPLRLQLEGSGSGVPSPPPPAPLAPEGDNPLRGEDEPVLAFVEETSVSPRSSGRDEGDGGSRIPAALYRVPVDGPPEEAWSSPGEDVFSVAAAPDGSVWLGAGSPARLLRLEAGGQTGTVEQFPEAQVTALLADPRGRLLVATGNGGSLYSLGPGRTTTGTFTSAALDAGAPSLWGRLEWDGLVPSGAKVEIQTRSGAGPVPDASWSGWSGSCPAPGCAVASPPGRYLQWRAQLTGGGRDGLDSPVVRHITLASLPRNRAPRLGPAVVPPADRSEPEVPSSNRKAGSTIKAPDAAGGSAPDAPAPDSDDERSPRDEMKKPDAPAETGANATKVERGAAVTAGQSTRAAGAAASPASPSPTRKRRRVIVTADDPDDDRLRWTASARPEGGGAAIEVPCEGEAPVLSWDDALLGEGRWILTVRASDSPSNAPGTEQTAQSESDPFVVDRTPPVLTVAHAARGELRVHAADALSPLERAEYSFDGATWSKAAVADGILDSREEDLLIPPRAAGAVWFRVADAAGNESRIQAGP